MSSQEETLAQVRHANERFYRAFEALDIDLMDAVWLHTERAKCVHPGWELLSGWEAVRKSWAAIFASRRNLSTRSESASRLSAMTLIAT